MPKSVEGHGQHIPGALQCCLQYGVEGSGWLETQAELVVLLRSLGSDGFRDRDQSPRLGLFFTFEVTELIHPIGETDA